MCWTMPGGARAQPRLLPHLTMRSLEITIYICDVRKYIYIYIYIYICAHLVVPEMPGCMLVLLIEMVPGPVPTAWGSGP
jgi:hypothetical protein